MRQNKLDNNCVIKSRSLSNDAMLRRNQRDECVTYIISCSFSLDEMKQARQMSNLSCS